MRQKISNFETFWCAWGHPAHCVLTCTNCYVCKMKQFRIWILMLSLLPFWVLILLQQCCISEGSFVIQSPIFLHTLAKICFNGWIYWGGGDPCWKFMSNTLFCVSPILEIKILVPYIKRAMSVNHSILPVFQRKVVIMVNLSLVWKMATDVCSCSGWSLYRWWLNTWIRM